MPFNGQGSFSLKYNWQNDAANGIFISSSRMMDQEGDIASGLSNCMTLDGQSTPLKPISMGGQRLINLADPTLPKDAANMEWVEAQIAAIAPYGAGFPVTTSIDAICLLDHTKVPQAFAVGRDAINDGGGGPYVYDSTDTSSGAYVTGSIASNTLTVTSVTNGVLTVGQRISGNGIASDTYITALGTGTGGVGTYTLNLAQTIGSTSISADDGGFLLVDRKGGRWKLQAIGPVSIKQMGGKGDGTTDDSLAIIAADASPYFDAYYFVPGIYRANILEMSKSFDMHVDAVIQYSGSNENDVLINFNGSNVSVGRVNVDGNSTNPLGLINLNGNACTFEEINAANQHCPADGIANGAVKYLGNQNLVKRCSGLNLTNGGNANVSVPQLLTYGGTSNQNTCEMLYGNNIRAGIVAFSTGTINYVGHADYVNINDNGCYMVMGYVSVKTLRYDGADEPMVSIGGGGDFGTVTVTSAGGANAVLGVNANGPITIGEILLRGPNSAAIILRSRGTGALSVGAPIRIGRISGDFYGNEPFFLNDTGNLDTLSIGSIDITHYYNSNSIPSQWCDFSAARRLNLGKVNIKVVDLTNAITTINMLINPSLAYPSMADTIAVSIYNSDGVTPSSSASFHGNNFFQPNMTYVGTANVHNSLAAIQKWDGTLPGGGGLFSTAAPTAGTWKRGQQIQRLSPNASATPGWVNVAAGTPGTFVQMANLQAS